MGSKIRIKIDYILRFFMIILFCSLTIFSTYEWGRYVMLAGIVAIGLVDVLQKRGKYRAYINIYLVTVMAFCVYAFLSSVWSLRPSDAVEKGKTLFEMAFMVFVLYNCYHGKDTAAQELLSVIKWSGYVIVLYSILFYGLDQLAFLSMAEERMDNTYANVNTIGMLAAIGVTIQLDEIIRNKKLKISVLFCVPSIVLLALTQSRKALVMLIVGIVLVVLLHNMQKGNFIKKLFRMVLWFAIGYVLLYFLLSLPIFSGMMDRMEGLIAGISGSGRIDNSTKIRTQMIDIGWTQFKETPLVGIGIGSPHLLALRHIGKDGYLHNNFIELLAGGGIIGFAIYYSMYAYLFAQFWKYRRYKNKEYIACLVIMVVLFSMDFGMVSYYNKMRYVYLLLYYLEVEQLKRAYIRSQAENES